MKKVSIVIPVYNVALYLRKCLDSVTAQSYRNIEIIAVDDGSTDDSGRICEEYAGIDPRVRVIHQENAGAANAKNTGLDNATGDYVTFLDSDDYVAAEWIERMLTAAEANHADVVECNFEKVFTDRCETGNDFPQEPVLFTAEEYLAQYLSNWTCSLFWTKLFDRNLIEKVRFRKERRCIDDEFFTYKAVTPARRIVRINDVLYHYRQRASSAVSSARNRKQITDDALEILIERYVWIVRHFPSLRKIYIRHDVDIMFYFASQFDHTPETAKKFRTIAGFYLRQCLLHYPGRIALISALRLQGITRIKLLSQKEVRAAADTETLFP